MAGERRLRAAKLAGLEEVPCILIDVNMEDASLIALVENLQRRDLDFIEEALGISQLIRMFGMSQEEAARAHRQIAVGCRKQAAAAEAAERRARIAAPEWPDRAARPRAAAPAESRRAAAALEYIVDNGLTVAATDAYIDALLSAPEEAEQKDEEKPEKRRTFVLKDVRVFLNTLSRSIDLMKQGGIDAGIQREETDDSLILTISIPKARQPSQNG